MKTLKTKAPPGRRLGWCRSEYSLQAIEVYKVFLVRAYIESLYTLIAYKLYI